MKTEEKIAYFQVPSKIKMIEDSVVFYKTKLQSVIDNWNTVCTNPLTLADITGIVKTSGQKYEPESIGKLLKSKLLEITKNIFLNGLEIDLRNMPIKLPVHSDLEALLCTFNSNQNPNEIYFDAYELKNNKIVVIESYVTLLKDSFIDYASTPLQKKKLVSVQLICDKINELVKQYPELNLYGLEIDGLTFQDENDVFCPHSKFINKQSN